MLDNSKLIREKRIENLKSAKKYSDLGLPFNVKYVSENKDFITVRLNFIFNYPHTISSAADTLNDKEYSMHSITTEAPTHEFYQLKTIGLAVEDKVFAFHGDVGIREIEYDIDLEKEYPITFTRKRDDGEHTEERDLLGKFLDSEQKYQLWLGGKIKRK